MFDKVLFRLLNNLIHIEWVVRLKVRILFRLGMIWEFFCVITVLRELHCNCGYIFSFEDKGVA